MAQQDELLKLSRNQAITTSAASDYYMDEPVVENLDPCGLIAEVLVRTTFTGTAGTTLQPSIEIGKDAAFATKKTLALAPAVDVADLVAGKQILIPLPHQFDDDYPYMRAYYTCSAAFTAGAVDTVLQPEVFTNHK